MTAHPFTRAQIDGVYRAIRERRDMRHFLPLPLDPALLERLLAAAHCAPSVGLMQPWRFVRIADRALRERIHAHVDEERVRTAEALGERGDEFMRLKVEGIRDCAEVFVVALKDGRERHVFGRRTMPHMDLASAACAIQNLWLAARAEGVGVGWVSLFEPAFLRDLCRMPAGAEPIAVLCIGHVERFYAAPMLEQQGWDRRMPRAEVLYQDVWGDSGA